MSNAQYHVLRADNAEELEREVTERLAERWTLVGGVSVCSYRYKEYGGDTITEFRYSQAMVGPGTP